MINSSKRLCSNIIYFRNIYANSLALAHFVKKINFIFLISWLIIIIIKSALNFVMGSSNKGNLIIKFIETELQGLVSICNDYSNLKNL